MNKNFIKKVEQHDVLQASICFLGLITILLILSKLVLFMLPNYDESDHLPGFLLLGIVISVPITIFLSVKFFRLRKIFFKTYNLSFKKDKKTIMFRYDLYHLRNSEKISRLRKQLREVDKRYKGLIDTVPYIQKIRELLKQLDKVANPRELREFKINFSKYLEE